MILTLKNELENDNSTAPTHVCIWILVLVQLGSCQWDRANIRIQWISLYDFRGYPYVAEIWSVSGIGLTHVLLSRKIDFAREEWTTDGRVEDDTYRRGNVEVFIFYSFTSCYDLPSFRPKPCVVSPLHAWGPISSESDTASHPYTITIRQRVATVCVEVRITKWSWFCGR